MKQLLLKVGLLIVLFTVSVNAQVLTPADNATGVSRLPSYTWTASTPNYTIQVYSDAGMTTLVYQATGLTTESYTPTVLLTANTQYWWKVTDSQGIPVEVTGTFYTDYLTSPASTITGVPLQPKLEWLAVTGATGYTVTVSTSNTFPVGPNTFTIDAGTNLFAVVPEANILTASTVYYWKVETAGVTNVSGTWSFQTAAAVTFVINNPTSGSTVYTLSQMLSWTSTPVTAIRYRVQLVQQTAMPANPTEWAAGINADIPVSGGWSNSFYTANGLVGGKTYWWRVIGLKSYGGELRVYGYSSGASFITSGGTGVTCTPSYPADGITVTTSPFTAYWYVDQYQTGLRYQIRYANAATVTAGELSDASAVNYPLDADMPTATTTSLFMTFPTLTNGATVYWQVRVYDPTGAGAFGAWSIVEDFVFQGPGTLVQPTLAYPIDDVVLYTTSPMMSWYLGQSYSGLTFNLYYRVVGAGAFTGPIDAGTSTFYTLSGLTPGESYEWYVASYNGVTESTPSTTETFSVAGGASTYAVATNPLDDLTVYTNTPTVSWYLEGANLGITGYNIEYKLQSSVGWTHLGATPTVSSPWTNFYELPALAWGGAYDWRVGTYDGATTTFNVLGEGSFIVTGGTSNPPVLSNPADASIVYSTTAYLSWYVNGSTAGIQNFILEYSPSPDFANPLLTTQETLSSSTLTRNLAGLTSGATYWWRVRAWYGGAVYADSPVYEFTIDLGSLSVVQPLIGGPHNVTVKTASPVLSWFTPMQAAAQQTYELEISENEAFQGSQIYPNLTLSKQAVTGLANGDYFWRVRGKSATGDYSYYSAIAKFSVNGGVVSVDKPNEVPTAFALSQNYPNPFNPTTTIKFSLPEASFVSLKIFDILGREVKTLVSQEMTAGSHIVNWNGDNEAGGKLSSGTYIYSISAGKFNQAKKMTLLK